MHQVAPRQELVDLLLIIVVQPISAASKKSKELHNQEVPLTLPVDRLLLRRKHRAYGS